jgi:DNA-directed RNA polymerase beta subunit
VYTLVVYDPKRKLYDIVERQEVKNMAEFFGFRYNNSEIDRYREGDTIKKGTVLYKSPALDEYENFRYGLNAKVVYVVSQQTIEDAVEISESYAKKHSFTRVESARIPINDNDILLNMYGDNETYKAFPDIGEWTKRSILCATRRRNKHTDQYLMKNRNLRRIFPNDDVFQTQGSYQVVDINIWSNKDYDDIPDIPAYQQIKRYYKYILDYWTNIYNIFGEIIAGAESGDYSYSEEFSRLYAKARDFLDPTCKWTDSDRMFSNMIVEFTFAKSEPLRVGSKICGRFGNKSVISRIVPDEQMGVTEDGTVPDIRMDALGVIGRLNSGQIIEQSLNWCGEICRRRMKELKSNNKRYKLLFKLLELTNRKQYQEMKEWYNELDENERADLMEEILSDRIYFVQPPLGSITGDQMRELYDFVKPKKSTIRVKDKDGEYTVIRKVVVADEYIMRLRHEPITKFSVRSKGLINPRSFLPIKSMKSKKHKSLYPDQANKLGEQELPILQLGNDPDALDFFYRLYASSVEARRSETLFTDDPMEGFRIDLVCERSKVIDILNAYFKAMGLKLVIEYESNVEDIEVKTDDSIEIPKYIKRMFE